MLKRTHTCGQLRPANEGETVVLCGWVNTYRDQGKGLIFIDLRDRDGMTQVVFDLEDAPAETVETARGLRREDVVAVRGTVRLRVSEPNRKLPTGEIEVVGQELDLLNKTEPPPILPDQHEAEKTEEEKRLRFRYIDLRRARMQHVLRTRHRVTKFTRDFFDRDGFLEIETPFLIKTTPEGARDYIVPSRLHPGKWYALPQSPQIFKQILMVAGCDRYMQIVRCFRDEDPRADRQAEFSQIDIEMSFVDRDDVTNTMGQFIRELWKEILGVEVGEIPSMTYREALDRYGIDRPDVRFGLELEDVSDLAAKTEFKVFLDALAKPGGVVKAIRVPGEPPHPPPGGGGKKGGAAKLTRKMTDGYSEFVKTFKAGGVPVVKYTDKGFETGIARFVEPIAEELKARLNLEPGDTVLFGADTYAIATKALGELRNKIARDLDLIPDDQWKFLWVVDFPMFEWDEETQRWYSLHHPFTAPNPDQVDRLEREPDQCLSAGYDLVLNGSELAGGSIRIHRPEIQQKVFNILGLSEADARHKFGFLLDALIYGAPPHGGIAFGLDRIVMHLVGTNNIRDVIAFPKTQTGMDLMTGAPGEVEEKQLEELHVRNVMPEDITPAI